MNERMTESERATLCRRIDELCAENEHLRQESQLVGMAAYEVGYRNGSVHYELEHCPACKNVADLQEALEENASLQDENARLRSCLSDDADNARQIMGENAWLLTQLADVIESMGRVEERCAKLREIVAGVGQLLFTLDVDYCAACPRDDINHPCPVHTPSNGECLYKTDMAELGIEVE